MQSYGEENLGSGDQVGTEPKEPSVAGGMSAMEFSKHWGRKAVEHESSHIGLLGHGRDLCLYFG